MNNHICGDPNSACDAECMERAHRAELRTSDKKVRPCFHNLFMPGRECKEPAIWRGKGTGNPTDRWTWCDKHVTTKPEYRERLP